MGLQLADKVTALDAFQATEGTAGHREAAESIYSPVQLSGSSVNVGHALSFTFSLKKKKEEKVWMKFYTVGSVQKCLTSDSEQH